MPRLPKAAQIDGSSQGAGFFLCARKDRRSGRSGAYLVVVLQDISGSIDAKVFQDVENVSQEFDAGEFVAVQGKGNVFNQRVELIVDRIRRVIPADAAAGFREEDCIPASPRPLDEMWTELEGRVASVSDPGLRALLELAMTQHGPRLKTWPAARQVHHAYRGGLLEHVLKIMEIALPLAHSYGLRSDLIVAGAFFHDIGKLEELTYDPAIDYSVAGNLVGHIVIGARMLHDLARAVATLSPEALIELEHLILSHHGSKELGSPVKPMTPEAILLAAADDLDAKLQQVRQHIADDTGPGPFTSYHRYLERVLLKPRQRATDAPGV